ncbi:MAG: XDD4 family exosortase-dependent surface protein [Planctomycetota bacterium]
MRNGRATSLWLRGAAWALVFFAGREAAAASVTFTATGGGLSASAKFEKFDTNLVITLTNTATTDLTVPSQGLTALFFDITGSPTLTPVSAILPPGGTIDTLHKPKDGPPFVTDDTPADGNVGGEFGYAENHADAPGGAGYGIGSAGLGIFGGGSFNGPDLGGPGSGALNGPDFMVGPKKASSPGDDPATYSPGRDTPIIHHAVVFTLSGFTAGVGDIYHPSFQYGTSLGEPRIPIPEPTATLLFGCGLAALGLWVRKRRLRTL